MNEYELEIGNTRAQELIVFSNVFVVVIDIVVVILRRLRQPRFEPTNPYSCLEMRALRTPPDAFVIRDEALLDIVMGN